MLRNESGAAAVEYAILIAAVGVACIIGTIEVGHALAAFFASQVEAIAGQQG